MNKKEHIECEIQKTLDQFDQTEQLPPNPFFSARVQAHLEDQRRQRGGFSMRLMPALLMILVALNLSTAIWYFSERQTQTSDQRQLAQILASDLMLENDQSDPFLIK